MLSLHESQLKPDRHLKRLDLQVVDDLRARESEPQIQQRGKRTWSQLDSMVPSVSASASASF